MSFDPQIDFIEAIYLGAVRPQVNLGTLCRGLVSIIESVLRMCQ